MTTLSSAPRAASVPFSLDLPLPAAGPTAPPPTATPVPAPVAGQDDYVRVGGSVAAMAAPFIPGAVAGGRAARVVVRTMQRSSSYSRGYSASRYGGYGGRGGYDGYGGGGYRARSYGGGRARVGSGASSRLGAGMWRAIKSSVIVGAVVSVALNGYALYKKQTTVAEAGSNVVGDVAISAVGGTAGAIASSLGCAMFKSLLRSRSALSLAGIGFGIAGYLITEAVMRRSNGFQRLQNGAYNLFASLSGAPRRELQPAYPGLETPYQG